MLHRIEYGLDCLLDHYIVACIVLAQFIMTLLGVGDVRTVGLVRGSAQVDLWVFLPMVFYILTGMASAFAVYGNISDGYASLQMIFPVLYLLLACLEEAELWRRLGSGSLSFGRSSWGVPAGWEACWATPMRWAFFW